MPSYETTIITKPSIGEEQVGALKAKVESVVQAHSGQVANFEDWGTRRLSYDIQKENRGRYLYFGFTGNNGTVAELERNLRINESVMRFLSIHVSDKEDLETLKNPSPMKKAPRKPALDDLGDLE